MQYYITSYICLFQILNLIALILLCCDSLWLKWPIYHSELADNSVEINSFSPVFTLNLFLTPPPPFHHPIVRSSLLSNPVALMFSTSSSLADVNPFLAEVVLEKKV